MPNDSRDSLSSAAIGAGLGAAAGWMLGGGPESAAFGAMAGLALSTAPDRRKGKRRQVLDKAAEERRTHFFRALASSKIESVETLAAAFRRVGASLAAKTLREHVADLRAVAAGKADEALVARFERKLALARQCFEAGSKSVQSAQANRDAAVAAQGGTT